MRKLKPAQLKSLSDFANTVAAAWFNAGIISPFFSKPTSGVETLKFLLTGLLMTWVTLSWSLSLIKEVKL